MKKYILTSLFSLLILGLFSQDTISHHSDSTGVLKIERIANGQPVNGKAPYYIYTGQHITIRTVSNPHPQSGILTAVNDSALVMDYVEQILYSEIKEIIWETDLRESRVGQNTCYITGGLLMAGGIATWANLFIGGSELGDGKLLFAAVVGVPMIVGGVILVTAGAVQNATMSHLKKQFPLHWRISSANNGSMSQPEKAKPYTYKTHKSK